MDAKPTPETIRNIRLSLEERETLRWADGIPGIKPTQTAIDALEDMGLIEDDASAWTKTKKTTVIGAAKLAMIGLRG